MSPDDRRSAGFYARAHITRSGPSVTTRTLRRIAGCRQAGTRASRGTTRHISLGVRPSASGANLKRVAEAWSVSPWRVRRLPRGLPTWRAVGVRSTSPSAGFGAYGLIRVGVAERSFRLAVWQNDVPDHCSPVSTGVKCLVWGLDSFARSGQTVASGAQGGWRVGGPVIRCSHRPPGPLQAPIACWPCGAPAGALTTAGVSRSRPRMPMLNGARSLRPGAVIVREEAIHAQVEERQRGAHESRPSS